MSYQDDETGVCPPHPPPFLRPTIVPMPLEEKLDTLVDWAAVLASEEFTLAELCDRVTELWDPVDGPMPVNPPPDAMAYLRTLGAP